MVSHESSYQLIRQDKAAGGTLYKHLRHRLKHRKRPAGGEKVVIPDKVSIDLRPEVVNKKERVGGWEVDTIVGKGGKGAILTVPERKTGFLLIKKLPKEKNAKGLAEALFHLLLPYLRTWFCP
jgi:IS30 family transposase